MLSTEPITQQPVTDMVKDSLGVGLVASSLSDAPDLSALYEQ